MIGEVVGTAHHFAPDKSMPEDKLSIACWVGEKVSQVDVKEEKISKPEKSGL